MFILFKAPQKEKTWSGRMLTLKDNSIPEPRLAIGGGI